jgi:hypothetical protein
MPACLFEKADRREGNGHRVDVRGLMPAKSRQNRRLVGHAVLGVLVAHEAFFFRRGDQLAVDVERGGGVVGTSAPDECQELSVPTPRWNPFSSECADTGAGSVPFWRPKN